ncbi:uncharacterized protein LOC124357073 isoform X5 [Homalodisca vitripennis]|uniref:uncharacterized protein LOC124357073 isoform X5 n=1 Tax=Homalodisca vitripennis TaxID=197043 RepID=UPI001EEB83C8|nr:uncharacterized protein LOC124357073 isoform X5 [Homalodisca vitripennis]
MDSVTTCLVPFLKDDILDTKYEDSQFIERLVIKDDLEILNIYPNYNLKIPYVKLEKYDVSNLLDGKYELQPSTSDEKTSPLQDGNESRTVEPKTIHLIPLYKTEPSLPLKDEQDCRKPSIAKTDTIQLVPVIKKELSICNDEMDLEQAKLVSTMVYADTCL